MSLAPWFTPQDLRLQCPPRNAQRPAPTGVEMNSTPMSIYDFIEAQLTCQSQFDLSLHRRYINPWSKLMRITDVLSSEGLFDDNNHCFIHMDFEPRNILLHMTSDLTALSI
jgi:hypothetical protein